VAALIGPQGEGKTWAGAIAMILAGRAWKEKTGQPLPGAIVRDSHANIKRMTVPSVQKASNKLGEGTMLQWKNDFKRLECVDGTLAIDLFGMDDLASLTRIQGAEYAWIWLEEPAPMIESANAGLSLDVYNACLSRVARALSTEFEALGLQPRLQITMNPADEEHWTFHELIENPRFPNPQFPRIRIRVYNIPYGENVHQSQTSRDMTKLAFQNNPGLMMRYVGGQFAFVQAGKAVSPNYNESIHRSDRKLDPIPGCPGLRFWDGGLNPTCILAQITPRGRVIILDSFVGENIGMRQLIRQEVRPMLESYRYKEARIPSWRDIGDPALNQREQSDSEQRAAMVIEDELGGFFEPGPVDWYTRREAVAEGLNHLVDGYPMVHLSRHEGKLHRALRGGWHYHVDPSGRVLRNEPIKNIHSHPGDAFGYGIAVIMGKDGKIRQKRTEHLSRHREAIE
jgi:hypothetical protein